MPISSETAIVGATLVVALGRHKACPYERVPSMFDSLEVKVLFTT
jgi:hypothetical protein